MSQRIKSSFYLAGFVIASLIYYNQTNIDQTLELANTDIEQVSTYDALD